MGKMQQTLCELLQDVGTITKGLLDYPSRRQVAASSYAEEVQRIYRRLGGVLSSFPLGLRPWDLEFNQIPLELDEYLHFNRYRAVTLESRVYQQLPTFPLEGYRAYSSAHEKKCLRAGGYGGKWSNRSCESQFGTAAAPKDLSRNGAPRWKQRAFYDFVKDLSPLITGVPVVRISVFDEVEVSGQTLTVEQILSVPIRSAAKALSKLIFKRKPVPAPLN